MAEVDKSMKLIFNEFQRAITEVPLEVYYQTVTSDQYSSSGFQFNVKQPGTNALLDSDVWIKYRFKLAYANTFIPNIFQNTGTDNTPQSNNRIALRGGNCVARCLQNFSVQLNNSTLNVQPYKYMDVLNRLYISNDQSEHEFSASGGRFDEGNHGARTDHVRYSHMNLNADQLVNGPFAIVGNQAGAAAQSHFQINLIEGYAMDGVVQNAAARDLALNIRAPYPLNVYEFWNPGFSRRFDQFANNVRGDWGGAAFDAAIGRAAGAVAPGSEYTGIAHAANAGYYAITLYERLPLPLFKMYSTDGVYGVIPNIKQMQIQGNFLTNMVKNLIRCDVNTADVTLDWTGISANTGELFLRWYTPPVQMAVPRELSIPYPKINTWSVAQDIVANNASNAQYQTFTAQTYNITLEAIPDLLLIYVKYAPFQYTNDTPDDCLYELSSLTINIDNASGKLNQMNSLDLYLKWKNLVKHQDSKIIGYNEWRKFCCVAVLQPQDYGCRYGPGYSNMTTLGLTATCVNWHNNPAVQTPIDATPAAVVVAVAADNPQAFHRGAGAAGIANLGGAKEALGGAAGAGAAGAGELFVTTIYNKNRFIIRDDGSANQELVKMAAEFNRIGPMPSVMGELKGIPPASI